MKQVFDVPIPVLRQMFPKIANNIEFLWGSQELENYLSKLVLQHPERHQEGFPPEALKEIISVQDKVFDIAKQAREVNSHKRQSWSGHYVHL